MKNNRFNSISVVPVRSLEVGDLIAMEFLRGVISGKVTGIAYKRSDLTSQQLAYMMDNKMDLPTEAFELVSGAHDSYLLFGEFENHPSHMYVSWDVNVAVFHPQPRPGETEIDDKTIPYHS